MPGSATHIHEAVSDSGVRLSVHRWAGPTAGADTVVLVHGFMGSVAAWGDLPARLALDRTVLVPELPGHGSSEGPRDPASYAIDGVAASLAQVVAAIDDGPADWVGYSMGGRILLSGVAEGHIRPRRLVLESSSPGLSDPVARARRQALDHDRADTLERDGLEAFVRSWLALPLFATQAGLPAAVRRRERLRRLQSEPRALAACLRGGGTGSQRSYWDALTTIRRPTTLITGDSDEKFGRIADRMASLLPDGLHRRVPDAGHAVHLERPAEWLAAVRMGLGIATAGEPPTLSNGPQSPHIPPGPGSLA